MSKSQRQFRIGQLLDDHAVPTAAELVRLLALEGIEATQATVARDLQELGAIKIRDEKSRRLAIPAHAVVAPAPLDHLRRMMGEWAVSIEHSGDLVVVRTPPGCAHVVASALDRSAVTGILGTVAGDDTILIIATAEVGGSAMTSQLRELAGLAGGAERKHS
jgi:transcriptional regulator of arginine metabolism